MSKIIIPDKNVFSEYLLSSIKESKKERKTGEFHSFKNNKAAINFLDKKTKC